MIGPGIAKVTSKGALQSPSTLQVDVIADLICPWCFMGKRRLDDALSAVHGPSLVTWYPFQLNPDMPANGMPFDEYLASKYGEPEQLEPALAQLTEAGLAEGIEFRFDRLTHVPNTLNAHRLMNLAEQKGVATSRLAETIMNSFFALGHDISDRDVLSDIGARFDLGHAEISAALESDQAKSVVLSQEAQVRQSGVTGVPDFLINKRLFVVGAQSTETLVSVFDRAMFGEESDLPVSPTVH